MSDEEKQIFFTNLLLLGLDPRVMENKLSIPFNSEMFTLPNKKGFEAIMYFLFQRLDPTQTAQTFRYCWPVCDKKQEQQFRKACNNWLTEIVKEDPDASNFPRVSAALFMSPGGVRFIQLLHSFSAYVIRKSVVNECGWKPRDFQQYPQWNKQNYPLSQAMKQVLACGVARQRNNLMENTQEIVIVQEQWKEYASELVKTHRSVNKAIRDLDKKISQEMAKCTDKAGSPVIQRSLQGYNLDIASVNRSQKVQKVRDLWSTVDDFHRATRQDQHIVESVLDRTLDKYKIDTKELNVKVPDLLLRECQREIQRRNAENIYEGGKLNLVSLVHLWNLSLHLYKERIHEVGIRRLESEESNIKSHVHTHHAHLVNAQTLRRKLEKEVIPDLRSAIKHSKTVLDEKIPNTSQTPSKSNWVGLELLPPTPPFSFSPAEKVPLVVNHFKKTKNGGRNRLRFLELRALYQRVKQGTPEAAAALSDMLSKKVRSQHSGSGLVQGSPLYGAKTHSPAVATVPRELRKPTVKTHVQKHATKASSVMHVTDSGTTLTELDENTGHARQRVKGQISPGKHKTLTKSKTPKRAEKKLTPARQSHSAVDDLADQIVDEVLSGSPSGLILGGPVVEANLDQPLMQLGRGAFAVRDKLAHTPPKSQNPLNDSSYGPLSSTRIDQYRGESDRPQNADKLACKLFTPEFSDVEDTASVKASNNIPSDISRVLNKPESAFSSPRESAISSDNSSQNNTVTEKRSDTITGTDLSDNKRSDTIAGTFSSKPYMSYSPTSDRTKSESSPRGILLRGSRSGSSSDSPSQEPRMTSRVAFVEREEDNVMQNKPEIFNDIQEPTTSNFNKYNDEFSSNELGNKFSLCDFDESPPAANSRLSLGGLLLQNTDPELDGNTPVLNLKTKSRIPFGDNTSNNSSLVTSPVSKRDMSPFLGTREHNQYENSPVVNRDRNVLSPTERRDRNITSETRDREFMSPNRNVSSFVETGRKIRSPVEIGGSENSQNRNVDHIDGNALSMLTMTRDMGKMFSRNCEKIVKEAWQDRNEDYDVLQERGNIAGGHHGEDNDGDILHECAPSDQDESFGLLSGVEMLEHESDVEHESVRVIEFQNGTFNEFLEKSPTKAVVDVSEMELSLLGSSMKSKTSQNRTQQSGNANSPMKMSQRLNSPMKLAQSLNSPMKMSQNSPVKVSHSRDSSMKMPEGRHSPVKIPQSRQEYIDSLGDKRGCDNPESLNLRSQIGPSADTSSIAARLQSIKRHNAPTPRVQGAVGGSSVYSNSSPEGDIDERNPVRQMPRFTLDEEFSTDSHDVRDEVYSPIDSNLTSPLRKSISKLSSMPISPMTDKLHMGTSSSSRLSANWRDLLDEDPSLLVPSSPGMLDDEEERPDFPRVDRLIDL